jgi:uncharacterized protein (DUF2235 family)
MKRIVLCLDGTWNQVLDPNTVTNVVKIAQAVRTVASDDVEQIVYYNSGVGTGDLLDRVLGGVFGRGLRATVKRAYAFLCLNFQPGDEIYIFGFSRGAYTARALAGVIGTAGILKKEDYEQFEVAWNYYRLKPAVRRALEALDLRMFVREPRPIERLAQLARDPSSHRSIADYVRFASDGRIHVEAKIRCVGVWDTVGSYGIPAGAGLGALSRVFTAWLLRGFHDTQLGKRVEIALHAVALDEKRRPFAPTFWTIAKVNPVGHVEQVWFPGAHANIGGSYPDCGLSDLSWIWMMARVAEIGQASFNSALEFDVAFVRGRAHAAPLGTLYRSEKWWPISSFVPYRRPVLPSDAIEVRAILWNGENPKEKHINEKIHWSVVERYKKAGRVDGKGEVVYEPRNLIDSRFTSGDVTTRTPKEAEFLGLPSP